MNTQTRGLRRHPDVDPEVVSYRDLAMLLYKERRDRDLELPEARDFWSDPAWDMLLDLFIATEEGRVVNVTSACIGACVPSTTGLRWIGQLSKARLVWRGVDPFDARKGTLGLTKNAVASMKRYLDRVGAARGYRKADGSF
ncbi:hypothetical protein O6Y00_00485 [Sphingomonas faeni]